MDKYKLALIALDIIGARSMDNLHTAKGVAQGVAYILRSMEDTAPVGECVVSRLREVIGEFVCCDEGRLICEEGANNEHAIRCVECNEAFYIGLKDPSND
jgi:hypothetical protein